MKEELIAALENPNFRNFITQEGFGPLFLKGGYEDLFSMLLFSNGFDDNSNLIPQFNIGGRSQIDLAKLNRTSVQSMVEFGHHFSLQFGPKAALDKMLSDVKKRQGNELLHNAELITVQLITTVIVVGEQVAESKWGKHFTGRYGVQASIASLIESRQRAGENILYIEEFLHAKNIQKPVFTGIIPVNSSGVHLEIAYVISGGFGFEEREVLLG